jgi:internalin A
MPGYEHAVFISYAWGGVKEEFVDEIDNALQKRGLNIIRDKRELEYKGSIKEFMERIGQGDCVIVVISDKYLRSPNCMFELVEIAGKQQFKGRVFPIILEDANIYEPTVQVDYVLHWEEKIKKLREALARLERGNTAGIDDQLNLYLRIRTNIDELTTILRDMNVLTPSMHQSSGFNELYEAIVKRMGFLPNSAEQPRVEEIDLDDWGKAKVNTTGLKNWFRSRFAG